MRENIPIALQASIDEPYGPYLSGTFDVPLMTNECLRYVLHVETPQAHTSVTVNGWDAGEVDGGELVIDVTDYITLDHNWLTLKSAPPLKATKVYLQPIPCADA